MLINNLIKDPAMQRRVTPPVMLGLTLGIFGILYPRDHAIAWGAFAGAGTVTVVTSVIMLLRRRIDNGFVRTATGTADERDLRILYQAAACMGFTALLGTAAAMMAVVWGADPMLALSAIVWLQLIAFIVSYLVIGRRS